jgi:hypothetical protein
MARLCTRVGVGYSTGYDEQAVRDMLWERMARWDASDARPKKEIPVYIDLYLAVCLLDQTRLLL